MMADRLSFAVADVHGMLPQLELMWSKIQARQPDPHKRRVIFLGDYVDRGPKSIACVRFLMDLHHKGLVECLTGNHEQMLLEILEPADESGFYQTSWDPSVSKQYYELQPHDRKKVLRWLRERPFWTFDDYRVYVHAGLYPGVPLESQTKDNLVWIRDRFLTHIGPYEPTNRLVVHGHTPFPHDPRRKASKYDSGLLGGVSPIELPNRVNLDTGCFFTGVLSCAVFDGSQREPIEYIYATGEPAVR